MKNPKRAQSYWGFNFLFKDEDMMKRFIALYEDLFLDYSTSVWSKPIKRLDYIDDCDWEEVIVGEDRTYICHVVVEKGTIPYIRESLGKLIRTTECKRYCVGY